MSEALRRAVIEGGGEGAAAALAFGSRCVGEDEGSRLWIHHRLAAMSEVHRRWLFPYASLGEDDRQFEAAVREGGRRWLRDALALDRWEGAPIEEVVVEIDEAQGVSAFLDREAIDLVVSQRWRAEMAAWTTPVALVRGYEPVPEVDRMLVVMDAEAPEDRWAALMETAAVLARRWGAALDVMAMIYAPALQRSTLVKRQLSKSRQALADELEPAVQGRYDMVLDAAGMEGLEEIPQSVEVAVGDAAMVVGERVGEQGIDLVVCGRGEGRRGTALGMSPMGMALVEGVRRHLVVVPPRHADAPLKRWRGHLA